MYTVKTRMGLFALAAMFFLFLAVPALSAAGSGNSADDDWLTAELEEDLMAETPSGAIADPLEPLNRLFFAFNDRLYFWVLKPVAEGYRHVVAADVRLCVRNAFYNLLGPVRVVNNLLQGKVKEAGGELAVVVINSTLGVAGLADPATNEFGLSTSDEDLGQTLGAYGIGGGIYICWPILGPSNLRDTVGIIGDSFLSPVSYLTASEPAAGIGAGALDEVNTTSFRLGEYERFKAATLDPYLATRDAYQQYRRNKIRDAEHVGDSIYSRNRAVPGRGRAGLSPGPRVPGEYFVQVGSSIDLAAAEELQYRLADRGVRSELALIDRGDYSFYGVRVPAGDDFTVAKQTEIMLVRSGFTETMLVQ